MSVMTDEEYVLARFHKEIKAELTIGREDQDLVAWSDLEISEFIELRQIELDQAVKAYIEDMDGPIDGQENDWFREVLYEYIEITPMEHEYERAKARQRVAADTTGPFGANRYLARKQEIQSLSVGELGRQLLHVGLNIEGDKERLAQKLLAYEIMYDNDIVMMGGASIF